MKKANSILLRYLVFALPFHMLFILGGLFKTADNAMWQSGLIKAVTNILMWNFLLWFLALFFIMAELLLNERFRSEVFGAAARLAGVKEQDERESMAVDKAGRYAFISTMSLLVILLFVLSLSVNIGNLPPSQWKDKNHKYISVGFGMALTTDSNKGKDAAGDIFSTAGTGLSAWSIVALITGWHLLGFFVFLRRENKYAK